MKLSKTQKNIVNLIGKGLTNKQIAEKLGLSKNTVISYIYLLSKVFEAQNRIELYNKLKEVI
jgi:DNA-binding NarL/FixJ family response regulator